MKLSPFVFEWTRDFVYGTMLICLIKSHEFKYWKKLFSMNKIYKRMKCSFWKTKLLRRCCNNFRWCTQIVWIIYLSALKYSETTRLPLSECWRRKISFSVFQDRIEVLIESVWRPFLWGVGGLEGKVISGTSVSLVWHFSKWGILSHV